MPDRHSSRDSSPKRPVFWNGLEPLEDRALYSTVTPAVAPAPTDPNLLYVKALYTDILGRSASDAEAGAWATLLDNKTSTQTDVVNAIMTSPEYWSNQVTIGYETILHRAPDAPGLAFFSRWVAHGLTIGQFYNVLVTSPEYLAAHPDSASYVSGLYHDLLGRTGSTDEINGWLNSGLSQSDMANDFIFSTERDQQILNAYYSVFLHRAPDPTGNTTFITFVQFTTVDMSILIPSFATSAEFYQVATGQPA